MENFDLAIAYTWEYDYDFINLLESVLQSNGLKTYVITSGNLSETYEKIRRKEICFAALFDRASDEDPAFAELPKLLLKQGAYIINRYTPSINKVVTKATMHKILLRNDLRVPDTFILPSHDKSSNIGIEQNDLDGLATPFVVKPSFYNGAGDAVNLFAYNHNDIQNTRLIYTDDQFLVQKKIYPQYLEGKRAWFRVYFFLGKIVPTWWDDNTHISTIMFPDEIERLNLKKLLTITRQLSKIAKLDYFSTEITLSEDGLFYLIDYVNDQCDFRFKSKFYDGVPEGVIIIFLHKIIEKILSLQKNKPSSIVRRIFK